jgi:hypothetical protein
VGWWWCCECQQVSQQVGKAQRARVVVVRGVEGWCIGLKALGADDDGGRR